MRAQLQFLGAADTVTGSRYLIETESARILVDCGLFQGYKVLRARNRAPFPVEPGRVDVVVLSHAHLDHSGYRPALIRDGFRGPLYATPGTIELCGELLPDSGYLMEEEARHAASRRWSTESKLDGAADPTAPHLEPPPRSTVAPRMMASPIQNDDQSAPRNWVSPGMLTRRMSRGWHRTGWCRAD